MMRVNTKERNKIEAVNQTIMRPDAKGKYFTTDDQNKTLDADVTAKRFHRMDGVGRVYESMVDQMVA